MSKPVFRPSLKKARPTCRGEAATPWNRRRRTHSDIRRVREDLRRPTNAKSVVDSIRQSVVLYPNHVAIAHAGQILSYDELWERSALLAQGLKSRKHRSPFVGLCLPRGCDLIAAMIACWRAGRAFVPLDPGYPDARLLHMINDSRSSWVITTDSEKHRFESATNVTTIAQLINVPDVETTVPSVPASEDLAYMIYTSGSTGTPKGVPITHRNLRHHNLWFGNEVRLEPNSRVLHFCSPSFDAALEEIFPTLVFGSSLIVRDERRLGPAEMLKFIEENDIEILNLPTAYWHTFCETVERLELRAPSCVHTCIIGGERAAAQAYVRWMRIAPGTRLINAYGPTETTITATAHDMQGGLFDGELPIGKPVAGLEAFVLTDDDRLADPMQHGELCLAGPGLSPGYWERPEATEGRFVQRTIQGRCRRIYRTGDRVYRNERGELMFVGRVDEQAKIRGFRVEPSEIERVLESLSNVNQGAVVTADDPAALGSQMLVAGYVGEADEVSVRQQLQAALPPYMVPTRLLRYDLLPALPNGKVDRRAIAKDGASDAAQRPRAIGGEGDSRRASSKQVASTEHHDDLPSNPTELALHAIWKDVLGQSRIGVDEDFFSLGGHSLLSLEVIERANAAGLPLEAGDFFEASTVRALARACDARAEQEGERDCMRVLQSEGDLDPVVLFHSMPGDLLGYGNLVHHLGATRPCLGFEAPGLSNPEQTFEQLQDMANYFAHRLLEVAPAKKLHLVGWCFGGHLAIETARALINNGRTNVSIAMLEGYPVLSHKDELTSKLRQLVKTSPSELARFAKARLKRAHIAQHDEEAQFALNASSGTFANRRHVYKANDKAYLRFRTLPIDAPMLLIRGEHRPGTLKADDYGWSSFVRKLTVHKVRASHETLLKEPCVTQSAQILKGWFTAG